MQSKGFTKVLSLILSLTFAFSAVFAANSVYGETISEKRTKIEKLQAESAEAQKKIDALAAEKKETQEYVDALDKKIILKQDEIDLLQADANELKAQISTIESNIEKTENEIEETQAEIDAKQAEFDETFDEYCQRLRAMYISGNASSLEVLLTCQDISSMLTRSQMIKSVSEQDSDALNSLMEKMSEIEAAKAELEAKRNQLNEDKAQLEEDKKQLEAEIAEIDAAKQELSSEVAEANAIIKKLSSEQNEYYELISDNKEEAAQTEKEIQAIIRANASKRSSSSGSSSSSSSSSGQNYTGGSGSGTFIYPTSYHTVSGGYPNYSSGRYHGALDFPCPSGTPVWAGGSGTVITATYHYSYGNYVMIDHGNGLVTLYAHNSSLAVSSGQHVSQGQVIAYSGSTGNSTGPHVHFEVRLNGQRVNPRNYLP